MPDYEPRAEEKEAAGRSFLRLVHSNNKIFKVGRCADDGRGGLKDRDMYDGCEGIRTIWTGAPGKASWLEKWLTRSAWKRYPDRCLNEKAGGGPCGEDPDHHVYVVLWAPTPDLAEDVQLTRLLRDIDTFVEAATKG